MLPTYFACCYVVLFQESRDYCYPLLSLLMEMVWMSTASDQPLSIVHTTSRNCPCQQLTLTDTAAYFFLRSSAHIGKSLTLHSLKALTETMVRWFCSMLHVISRKVVLHEPKTSIVPGSCERNCCMTENVNDAIKLVISHTGSLKVKISSAFSG